MHKGCATNECRNKAAADGIERLPAVVVDGCGSWPHSGDELLRRYAAMDGQAVICGIIEAEPLPKGPKD